jgi:hypothetical protein
MIDRTSAAMIRCYSFYAIRFHGEKAGAPTLFFIDVIGVE